MYININTLQYPISEREIREATPNVSYAVPFNPDGYAVVFETPKPAYNPITQTVIETTPVLTIKGTWEQVWQVVALGSDVIEANLQEANRQLQKAITDAIQNLLDTTAQQYRYDNIHNACGWAPELPDAVALKAYGVACWNKAGQLEAEILAGTRPIMTVAEFMAEMPVFTLED